MQVYVAYMGEKPRDQINVKPEQYSMLESVLGSYGRSFNGFAAKLSDEEVARLSDVEGVISVLPNTMLQLHTTRSWDFIGFIKSYVKDSEGGDVIIGIIDSGIWPEADSFSDEGFGPPPEKWKGSCSNPENFTCNNKLIGARYYNSLSFYHESDIRSPRDGRGHGTHTASTAADILAAFDDAIADRVDIVSVSFGTPTNAQYFDDPTTIGSFHAMRKGILTVASAGNDGPQRAIVSNYAPWILTVAATNSDRKFISQLILENGQRFEGYALNNVNLHGKSFLLIWGGDAANVSGNVISLTSKYCYPGELDSNKVTGKIVLCEGRSDASGITTAGGVGAIMPRRPFEHFALPFPLPATLINSEEIDKVLEYIRYSKNPEATVLVTESWKDDEAPYIASFSSRGPSPISPDVVKPDISAPGVNILAAWSPIAPLSPSKLDTRRIKYNMDSGTSMSCPHVSSAAAHVKATHPDWSPAAVKSALMTTAYLMDAEKHENEREFAYGSGLLNPVKAIDPGLVFNASEPDYNSYLCKQGYNTTTLRLITGERSVCRSPRTVEHGISIIPHCH
ncbi:cucumisin-like [Quillaja saponaria]|uniref:Cucumisin-like n=1 Tax=Quillaja saponaria TaxID=32244 RepID=A0AAD7M6R5_QUISA|nr:cucumisin-like [Quillaja saponaria]